MPVAVCHHCKCEVHDDDIAIPGSNGRCVCLRCFERITESERPMPPDLRRDVIEAVNKPE